MGLRSRLGSRSGSALGKRLIPVWLLLAAVGSPIPTRAAESEKVAPEEAIRGLLEHFRDGALFYYELVDTSPSKGDRGPKDPGNKAQKQTILDLDQESPPTRQDEDLPRQSAESGEGGKRRLTIAGFEYTRKRALNSSEIKDLWQKTLLDPRNYSRSQCRRTGTQVSCQRDMAACFYPGAAVQFVKEGQRLTFVICLGCGEMQILGKGVKTFVGLANHDLLCRAEKQSAGQCAD